MAVNQPKAPRRGTVLKASRYGYNQGKNQGNNPKSQSILQKTWKVSQDGDCQDFALFSREDDGPRRSNRVGEDDGLKQEANYTSDDQSTIRSISRLTHKTSRLEATRTDTEAGYRKKTVYSS